MQSFDSYHVQSGGVDILTEEKICNLRSLPESIDGSLTESSIPAARV